MGKMKMEEEAWGVGNSEDKDQKGLSCFPSPLSWLSRYITFLLFVKLEAQDKTSAEFLKLWFIVSCALLPPLCEINRGKIFYVYKTCAMAQRLERASSC